MRTYAWGQIRAWAGLAGWEREALPGLCEILCEARTSTALSFSAVALFKDSGRVHTRGDPLRTDGLRGRQGWAAGVDFEHFLACFPADRGSCLEKLLKATGDKEVVVCCTRCAPLRAAGRQLFQLLFTS